MPFENSFVIETERLRLRMLRDSDLDDLAALFADPDVMRYVGSGQPIERSEAQKALTSIAAHWNRHGFGRWAIEDKNTREFIGYGGLRSLFGTPKSSIILPGSIGAKASPRKWRAPP
jgi:ribosomal-protein-alanine N-acetyltransferase